MNNALPLHHNLHLFGPQPEQPHSLNKLQPLVHHACRINGYLGPHCPVRVAQRILLCHMRQLLPVPAEKRPAGSSQQYFLQSARRVFVLKALKDGRVLAVYRQKLYAVFLRSVRHKIPARHKALFICQRYVVPRLQSRQRGRKARNAHYRVQHHVRLFHAGKGHQTVPAAVNTRRACHARKARTQRIGCAFVRHGNGLWGEFRYLLKHSIHIFPGSQRQHLVSLCAGHVQALRADGAGRAQQNNLFCHAITPPSKNRRTAPRREPSEARCQNGPEYRRARGKWFHSL